MPTLLTKQEVAALLGGEGNPVSLSFINQLLARKKLAKVSLSYRVCRIPKDSVEEFIRTRTVEARAPAKRIRETG